MKQPELGKRLKEARIAKKMTQSEVVGTFITRNMLSQIESGKAMPSVETLQYLSEVLGISPQSLISTPEAIHDPLDLLSKAKVAYENKHFSDVLSLCDVFPPQLNEEGAALSALASCELAEQYLSEHRSAEAADLAQKALEASKYGLYANELVHSRALLLYSRAAQDVAHSHE